MRGRELGENNHPMSCRWDLKTMTAEAEMGRWVAGYDCPVRMHYHSVA